MAGLFNTIYNKMGIYGGTLYSKAGASSPSERTDSRLGQTDVTPEEPASETTIEPSPSFFSRDTKGVPNWLIGLFFLGFALAHRRNEGKAQAILSKPSA